jgi:VWFA-related protein
MQTRAVSTIVWVGVLVAGLATAQALPPQAPADSPAAAHFATGAEAVALDIVVRDKKGRLVGDLQASEVEVLEDGVPQKVTSFRRVETAAAAGAAASTASPASAPRPVVLVFGRLSSNGRRLAQDAGEQFARKFVDARTQVSVVRVDGGIIPVLDRSSDPVAVKEGVRKATGAVAGAQGLAGGPKGADNSYSGQQLARFSGGAGSQDLSNAENLAMLGSLASLVDGLAREAGRKTLLVFCEGFTARLRARLRRPDEPREPGQRQLLRDRRAGAAAADAARQFRRGARDRGDDQRVAAPGRWRGPGDARPGHAGRRDAVELSFRRGGSAPAALREHGGLPGHADERVRSAARAHR